MEIFIFCGRKWKGLKESRQKEKGFPSQSESEAQATFVEKTSLQEKHHMHLISGERWFKSRTQLLLYNILYEFRIPCSSNSLIQLSTIGHTVVRQR